ncbi:hypothetical protein A2713_02415 [candidate division WWE3 bacterium RIFCSPHIGHO2_01_FULL_35_17]|uniref:Uncharacterized protein n=1 Tax=candidate division WWE3 bacterium RIFCSPHIGHO2_01_FULL_35_17 TaxID=1802614 RepID=A0A1F4USN9_UNCKA|nr:MAG: hypothetical protein A2713_02415 [candidate division WWE3 bacterium RIFCSPHIGHO2_01_FULL_35_17]
MGKTIAIAALVDYPMFDVAIKNIIVPSLRECGFTSRTTVIANPQMLANETLRTRVLAEYDVYLIHKDYGARVNGANNAFLEGVHRTGLNCLGLIRRLHEENPYARTIVTSGEYPDGIKSCLNMEADVYINIAFINPNPPYSEEYEYVIDSICKGKLTKQEMENRGRDLQMFQEDRERFNFRFEEFNNAHSENMDIPNTPVS